MEWFWNSLTSNPFSAMSMTIAATALIVFQWWRQRKGIRYCIVSTQSVAGIRDEYNDKVKILFEDRPVKKVHLIVTEIANNGWRAIEPGDFVEPITINYGKEAEIMDCRVIDCVPDNVKLEVTVDNNVVTLKPMLLNRNDSARIKVLVDNYAGKIEIESRVKDVSQLKESDGLYLLKTAYQIGSLLIGLAIMGAIIGIFFSIVASFSGNQILFIKATVLDAANSKPLKGVLVIAENPSGTIYGGRTSSSGVIEFQVTGFPDVAQTVNLHTDLAGYRSIEAPSTIIKRKWFYRIFKMGQVDITLSLEKNGSNSTP